MTDKKDESRESELENGIGTAVPILTNGIGTRISEAAQAVGGKRGLAELISLSEAQLHRVIAGTSQAKVEAIAEIAAATGYSIEWLATGGGPRRKGGALQAPDIQEGAAPYKTSTYITPDALAVALESVERAAAHTGVTLDVRQRARLALLIHDYALAEAGEGDGKGFAEKLLTAFARDTDAPG